MSVMKWDAVPMRASAAENSSAASNVSSEPAAMRARASSANTSTGASSPNRASASRSQRGTWSRAGGYRLAGGAVEDRIGPTVHDLEDLVAPRIVAPGHCTGWRAAAALAGAFSPARYAPSFVGTRYLLGAR
jgi:hypothetical protein